MAHSPCTVFRWSELLFEPRTSHRSHLASMTVFPTFHNQVCPSPSSFLSSISVFSFLLNYNDYLWHPFNISPLWGTWSSQSSPPLLCVNELICSKHYTKSKGTLLNHAREVFSPSWWHIRNHLSSWSLRQGLYFPWMQFSIKLSIAFIYILRLLGNCLMFSVWYYMYILYFKFCFLTV